MNEFLREISRFLNAMLFFDFAINRKKNNNNNTNNKSSQYGNFL